MKISVITATYNAATTVASSLASLARQDHEDIEHWVIDGVSHDGTQELVRTGHLHAGGVISEPDNGLYDALNKGIQRATGDVLGFLHADDVYAHDHVLSAIAAAFENPTVEAVYGDLTYVDRHDPSRVIRYWEAGPYDRSNLARGWMPPHPTFYARRSVYERLGGFDTRYRISADYECLLRFLFTGAISAVYLPQVLVSMRLGGVSNRSLRTILLKSSEDLQIMRRHRVGGLHTLVRKNVGKVAQFWRR